MTGRIRVLHGAPASSGGGPNAGVPVPLSVRTPAPIGKENEK
jgi:hypothetical protein